MEGPLADVPSGRRRRTGRPTRPAGRRDLPPDGARRRPGPGRSRRRTASGAAAGGRSPNLVDPRRAAKAPSLAPAARQRAPVVVVSRDRRPLCVSLTSALDHVHVVPELLVSAVAGRALLRTCRHRSVLRGAAALAKSARYGRRNALSTHPRQNAGFIILSLPTKSQALQ